MPVSKATVLPLLGAWDLCAVLQMNFEGDGYLPCVAAVPQLPLGSLEPIQQCLKV